jgi:hypothetical protein
MYVLDRELGLRNFVITQLESFVVKFVIKTKGCKDIFSLVRWGLV